MFLSTQFLKNAVDKYRQNRQNSKEGYLGNGYPQRNVWESSGAGISYSFDVFILAIAIIFFIIEFLLIYYAVSFALRCTKSGTAERVAMLALAVIFPSVFVLFSLFFGKCQQGLLKESDVFLLNPNSFIKNNS